MRIFDEKTLKYVATDAGGFDYIIDEIEKSIFFFDWRYKIIKFNVDKINVLDIKPVELVNKQYLNTFSKIYVNAVFSHLIVVYDYVNLVLFSSI